MESEKTEVVEMPKKHNRDGYTIISAKPENILVFVNGVYQNRLEDDYETDYRAARS